LSYLYTLEKAERNATQKNLTNIIDPIVGSDDSLSYYPYYVLDNEAMRIDMICYSIYGNFEYIDELLTINNILNPWSIRAGDIIYFLEEDDMASLRISRPANQADIVAKLVNPNKDTQKDPNRDSNSVTVGTGLPPSIKPNGLKDVNIDFDNKVIKIIDTLK